MKNVDEITRSTSMPIIAAASRSNDVARIAFPSCVRATNSVSATISATAEATTRIRIFQMKTSPMWMPPNADEVERVVVAEARAEQEQRAVLEEERDAERGDQRRDARRVAQRPVREALDHDAEAAGADHRDGEHERDQRARR